VVVVAGFRLSSRGWPVIESYSSGGVGLRCMDADADRWTLEYQDVGALRSPKRRGCPCGNESDGAASLTMTRYSSRYITRRMVCKVVSAAGLEPATHALKEYPAPLALVSRQVQEWRYAQGFAMVYLLIAHSMLSAAHSCYSLPQLPNRLRFVGKFVEVAFGIQTFGRLRFLVLGLDCSLHTPLGRDGPLTHRANASTNRAVSLLHALSRFIPSCASSSPSHFSSSPRPWMPS